MLGVKFCSYPSTPLFNSLDSRNTRQGCPARTAVCRLPTPAI
jgi:hypothetical protein